MTCRRYLLTVGLCIMTLLHRVLLPILAAGLLSGTELGAVLDPVLLKPSRNARVASALGPPPDTVHTSADAGTPLALALPDTLDNRPVARYSLLQGPALSGIAGRSFAWIPKGTAPGTHHALLQAESTNAPPDTLVVQIRVRP
ncbi:hypothetical protein [Salinibacter altiplanensis]|uniref:hypothetical protein n=1 Tax=Salinibacter altiplanensis TaxID=1803181 RepID=UPI000C9ECDD9|nr:hypothetical protein [Salinibacter altiplanensis]